MDDKIKVIVNGEKGSLLIGEQNGVLGQVSSPSGSGRREMVSRHVIVSILHQFFHIIRVLKLLNLIMITLLHA